MTDEKREKLRGLAEQYDDDPWQRTHEYYTPMTEAVQKVMDEGVCDKKAFLLAAQEAADSLPPPPQDLDLKFIRTADDLAELACEIFHEKMRRGA